MNEQRTKKEVNEEEEEEKHIQSPSSLLLVSEMRSRQLFGYSNSALNLLSNV